MVGFCGLLQRAEITCTSAPSRLMTKPTVTEVSIQSTACSEQKQCREKSDRNKQLMHLSRCHVPSAGKPWKGFSACSTVN